MAVQTQYDFKQFRSGKLFYDTSQPIEKTIIRLQSMYKKIMNKAQAYGAESKIIFLTARADFDSKAAILNTFKKYGIQIDNKDIFYIERTGNIKEGSVPQKKKKVIATYLDTGKYDRARIIDDHKGNILEFLKLKKDYKDVRFFGLLVDEKGTLKQIH